MHFNSYLPRSTTWSSLKQQGTTVGTLRLFTSLLGVVLSSVSPVSCVSSFSPAFPTVDGGAQSHRLMQGSCSWSSPTDGMTRRGTTYAGYDWTIEIHDLRWLDAVTVSQRGRRRPWSDLFPRRHFLISKYWCDEPRTLHQDFYWNVLTFRKTWIIVNVL